MSATGPWVTVEAPAKLTLSLRVTGVRSDGYHLLDAEMVTVDLLDRVAIAPGRGVTVAAPGGAAVTGVPAGPGNLAARALAVLGREAAVSIEKRIPPGAGLGGGSADAAAVLRWGGCRDLALAARLGADVPFCLLGGRARVHGIGERVEPLPAREGAYTLLVPPVVVPTAAVYRRWDELGGPHGPGGNDLEPAALGVVPELATWRDRLGEATGETPSLAGSGGTWFVRGSHEVPVRGARVVTVRTRPADLVLEGPEGDR